MAHSHLLTTAADAKVFVLAGNARITLVSQRTGQRFTYRVRLSNDGRVHFVSVLSGPDNETSYQYLGVVRDRKFSRTAKSRITEGAPSHLAFDFFWAWVVEKDRLPAGLECWHEGSCGRCGRPLTVPSSIERGIGPDCAEMMGIA